MTFSSYSEFQTARAQRAKVRILLTEDHGVLRDGIRALLVGYDEFEIIGEASDGNESVRKALELAPDVILMDLVMPEMNGLEATRRIRKTIPTARILFLTQYETKQHILSALQAGATGYVSKRVLSSDLVAAIRAVNQGDYYLSASAARALVDGYRHKTRVEPYDRLTVRQKEMLKLTAEGYTSREIGSMINISFKTVQCHRMKLAKKLGISNQTELIKYAAHKGLITVNNTS